MRITYDALMKLAKETVEKRFSHDSKITAVFLIGSLRPDHTQVDSVADVDILVLHNGDLPRDREIVKLSNEYHLDILYEPASLYSQPRELRGDGWRGWLMWDPRLLFQKGRFFEYTQSVVRAQFDDPANIIKRARFFSAPARETWFSMQANSGMANPSTLLNAIFNAANSLVSLTGAPIPERRLLAEFPARAKSIQQDDMIHTLFTCVSSNINTQAISQWLPAWEQAFKSASQSPGDLRLHPARFLYYKSAIDAQIASDLPAAAIWPMLITWALAAESGSLTEQDENNWKDVCSSLGLNEEGMPHRLQALDGFLDRLEEILEQVSVDNGL